MRLVEVDVVGLQPLQRGVAFAGLLVGPQHDRVGLRVGQVDAGLLGVADVGGRFHQAGEDLIQVV